MGDRPSVPYSATNPGAKPSGRQRTIPPHEWPAATPTGDMASAKAAADSDVGELVDQAVARRFQSLEERIDGRINRAMDRVVGAQQTVREETLEQRLKRVKGVAYTVGIAAAFVAIAVGSAVLTLREYWGTAEKAAAAEAAPLEDRVDASEGRLLEIEDELDGIGRTLTTMGRVLERIDRRTTPDDDEEDAPRRRPR